MWLTLFFVGTAALFLAMTSSALFHLQWARVCLRCPTLVRQNVAAARMMTEFNARSSWRRDEESRIGDTVRHLLAQRDVQLEVIVIDDRSTDRTDEVLRRLAQLDDRVRTQRLMNCPMAGWENAMPVISRRHVPKGTGFDRQMPTAG